MKVRNIICANSSPHLIYKIIEFVIVRCLVLYVCSLLWRMLTLDLDHFSWANSEVAAAEVAGVVVAVMEVAGAATAAEAQE